MGPTFSTILTEFWTDFLQFSAKDGGVSNPPTPPLMCAPAQNSKLKQTVATISALSPLFLNSFRDPWYDTCFKLIHIYFRGIFLSIIVCTINVTPTEKFHFISALRSFELSHYHYAFLEGGGIFFKIITLYNDFIQYVPHKR